MFVQKLTFLVSGLAFILGVASAYFAPPSGPLAGDERQLVPADMPEEMGETTDPLDLEDDLDGLIEHGAVFPLHPPTFRDVFALAPTDILPPSPFLDPLLRPPCLA